MFVLAVACSMEIIPAWSPPDTTSENRSSLEIWCRIRTYYCHVLAIPSTGPEPGTSGLE